MRWPSRGAGLTILVDRSTDSVLLTTDLRPRRDHAESPPRTPHIPLKTHRKQRLLQPFQAAPADEANGSDGQTKTLRDVAVRQRRLDVKQQPDHLLAPWRETRGRIPHDL